jgi:GNAT superfamily N-acetyltransferase
MRYATVALNKTHKKEQFNCGNYVLDNYIQNIASQDVKRNLSACFVLEGKNSNKINGFYTLSSTSIFKEGIPSSLSKKLPASYAHLPSTLLGRLAIDKSVQGQGLGELLLIDALKRSYDVAMHSVGSLAVIVDPIDYHAYQFYLRYGFIPLPDLNKLFLPMSTLGNYLND